MFPSKSFSQEEVIHLVLSELDIENICAVVQTQVQ